MKVKYTKKIMFVLMLMLMVISIIPNKTTNASGTLVGITTSSGSDLTYRNSTEKVYRLSEYNYPTNQLRAAWVSHFAGDVQSYQNESQYKQMMTTVMDNMVRMGMNAMIYHIRTHNNAMYNSKLNPRARWWANVDFDKFDPLEWLISECHSRGIEFHAWLNPYRVSTNGDNPSNSVGSLPSVNPANNPDNLITVGNSIILDPGIPEVRDFIVDTCMEIVENYDIDAIHFDDYFYISGADDSKTREKYNTEGLSLGDFRRKQVDLFIEDLSNHLRSYNTTNNRCVQLGISPSNVYRNGGYSSTPRYDESGNLISPLYSNTGGFAHYDDYLYSDTLNWINHEWIDYIMPQCYHSLENKYAPYADCIRWWSWAVRYKKVNLYAGLGIYKALEDDATWKAHTDEIKLQLLFSAQYEEFKGASFYKYASLLKSSNSVVSDAVNTISNDYWKKRIPGAVIPYYKSKLAKVAPENVKFNSGVISWDAVDNVRGYMVYKVPVDSVLDQNNYDYIYQYTTSTSVVTDNTVSYNYYVASVNLANEVSNPVLVNLELSYVAAIKMINDLPSTVTYDQKANILQIRKYYESLSDEDKAKVLNIDKLVEAEKVISRYDVLSNKLDTYINSIDKHIKTDRVLPTDTYITLAYKNTSDAEKYNLTTGKRLKDYLAKTYITIIATIEYDNLTLSKNFDINIGYVGENQNGLFYRNDPSSMSEVDEGECGVGTTKHIGWSGHTVVVNNNVLFIAKDNYFEINDASQITRCNWASVAGTYVNKTGAKLSFTMGDAFESRSSNNDGFFIISNNKIKEISAGFDSTKTINLENDEAVVIVRYLDSTIEASPLVPVTQLEVGTKAYIDEETVASDEELAQVIIKLINDIETPITLSSEQAILKAKAAYENATQSVKSLVTNSNLLDTYYNEYLRLKAEKELTDYKNTKKNQLKNSVNLNDYSSANQAKITDIINETLNLIDSSTTTVEVDNNIKSATEKIAKIKTIATEEKELQDYRNQYIQKIDDLIASYDVSDAVRKELNTYGDKFKKQIQNETSYSEINYIYTRVVATLREYFENAEIAKNEAKKAIDDYVAELNYSQKEMAEIAKKVTVTKATIDELASISEIINYPEVFKEEVTDAHNKLQAKIQENIGKLNELPQSWYSDNQNQALKEIIANATTLLKEAGTIEEADKITEDYLEKGNSYITELRNKIDEAQKYFESKKIAYLPITNLVSLTKKKVFEVATIEEVVEITEEFDTTYDVLYSEYLDSLKVKVTFSNEGALKIVKIEKDTCITKPVDPTKEGYTFLGWYNGDELFDFNQKVTSDIQLVAKWEKIKKNNCNGNAIILKYVAILICLSMSIVVIKKHAFR